MTETTLDLRAEMRRLLETSFLYMHPGVELADDDKFLDLGIIDSMGLVELVEEIESRYGVKVADGEITEGNFGSIDAMVRYVEKKLAGR